MKRKLNMINLIRIFTIEIININTEKNIQKNKETILNINTMIEII